MISRWWIKFDKNQKMDEHIKYNYEYDFGDIILTVISYKSLADGDEIRVRFEVKEEIFK